MGINSKQISEPAVLHIGHRFRKIFPKSALNSTSSLVQFLDTKGIPMATKPHPNNGTHFKLDFAKYLQRPSIPLWIARAWMSQKSDQETWLDTTKAFSCGGMDRKSPLYVICGLCRLKMLCA